MCGFLNKVPLIIRGGKALTMTMKPWNLPHGQWSKKLTMTMKPWNLPMVNGQIDKFWPFDHRNSSILALVTPLQKSAFKCTDGTLNF